MTEAHSQPRITPGRALIVRNPRARRALGADALRAAARPLERAGWACEFVDTRGPHDAAVLARDAAADGVDVVVACGGDGTVGDVLNGLAGSDAALAVVPCGTANVWAREAFVPGDAGRAFALVAHGRRVRIDVGEAAIGDGEPRRFLLMCGIGVDAAVVGAVEARLRLKRVLGRMAFVAAGAPLLAGLRAVPTAITHDGATDERALLIAIAGNTRLYGGMARLTEAARVDDGLLDVVVFSDRRPEARLRALRYLALAGTASRGGLSRRAFDGIDYLRTRELTIAPERATAVQADGEAIGIAGPEGSLRLRALPRALTVVIARRPNVLLGEA